MTEMGTETEMKNLYLDSKRETQNWRDESDPNKEINKIFSDG